MSEDDWAELAQDIPAPGDAVLQTYMQGREALMAEEQKQRSGT